MPSMNTWFPELFAAGRYPHLARLARLAGLRMFALLALVLVPLGTLRNLWIGSGPGLVQLGVVMVLLLLLRLRLRTHSIRVLCLLTLVMFPVSALFAQRWPGQAEPPTLLVYPLLVYLLAFTQDRALVLGFGLLGLVLPGLHYWAEPARDLQGILRRWDLGLVTLVTLFTVLVYRAAIERVWIRLHAQRRELISSLRAARDLDQRLRSGVRLTLDELKLALHGDGFEAQALAKSVRDALREARRSMAEGAVPLPGGQAPGAELEVAVRRRAFQAYLAASLVVTGVHGGFSLAVGYSNWSLVMAFGALQLLALLLVERRPGSMRAATVGVALGGLGFVAFASWQHQGARAAAGMILMINFIGLATLAHGIRLGALVTVGALLCLLRMLLLNQPGSLHGESLAWNSNLAELLLSFGLISSWNWGILANAMQLWRRRGERLRAAQQRLQLLSRSFLHDLAGPVMELDLNLSALDPSDEQQALYEQFVRRVEGMLAKAG